jgi:hypothetical protein
MNFFYHYNPIESYTKKTAVDKDPENIVDFYRRILDEINERAKRCKKHDFEYRGLCIDDPEDPFDVFICKYCGKMVAEGSDNLVEVQNTKFN